MVDKESSSCAALEIDIVEGTGEKVFGGKLIRGIKVIIGCRGKGNSPGENPKTQGGNSFWIVCPKSSNKQLTIEFTAHNVLDSSYSLSIVMMSFFFSPSYSSTQ